jgi:hypothetical protein
MAQRTSLLTDIRPGMDVYDLEGNKVGTVKYVKFPEGDIFDVYADDDTTMKDVVAGLNSAGNIPPEVRDRFLSEGFVKLNTGILRSGRYITADQIRSVSADRVTLRVLRDELM